MRMRFETILAAVAAGAAIPFASMAVAPEAVSADYVYAADSRTSPRAVKTAEELGELTGGTRRATRRAGEVVTLKSPNGTVTTLVSADSAATSATLPLDAGGLWTVVNSKQGTATFTVRHSLKGTLGDGTAASPAKLVDGDELVDYSAGAGYVFTLNGGNSLLGALRLPAGARIENAGSAQKWRIASSGEGEEYAWAQIAYVADAKSSGPDRVISKNDSMPVSYSGDNWARVSSAASTLTLTAPSGAVSVYNLAGTNARTVRFNEVGEWLVALAAGGDTLTSTINVLQLGTFIFIK